MYSPFHQSPNPAMSSQLNEGVDDGAASLLDEIAAYASRLHQPAISDGPLHRRGGQTSARLEAWPAAPSDAFVNVMKEYARIIESEGAQRLYRSSKDPYQLRAHVTAMTSTSGHRERPLPSPSPSRHADQQRSRLELRLNPNIATDNLLHASLADALTNGAAAVTQMLETKLPEGFASTTPGLMAVLDKEARASTYRHSALRVQRKWEVGSPDTSSMSTSREAHGISLN